MALETLASQNRKRDENMRIDKTISNKFIRVDMTPQEYNAFVRLMKAMDNHLKDYKGGK